MSEEYGPLEQLYNKYIRCKNWPYPVFKKAPCRFPALRVLGLQPCELCWRKYIKLGVDTARDIARKRFMRLGE